MLERELRRTPRRQRGHGSAGWLLPRPPTRAASPPPHARAARVPSRALPPARTPRPGPRPGTRSPPSCLPAPASAGPARGVRSPPPIVPVRARDARGPALLARGSSPARRSGDGDRFRRVRATCFVVAGRGVDLGKETETGASRRPLVELARQLSPLACRRGCGLPPPPVELRQASSRSACGTSARAESCRARSSARRASRAASSLCPSIHLPTPVQSRWSAEVSSGPPVQPLPPLLRGGARRPARRLPTTPRGGPAPRGGRGTASSLGAESAQTAAASAAAFPPSWMAALIASDMNSAARVGSAGSTSRAASSSVSYAAS